MSEGPGFLEFFILEASDYVEQLDGLLLGGSPTGPDADALQRVARALRGTATMAKLPSFAELAAGVERVGRAMQEGVLRWDPALGGAMIATIDDLKSFSTRRERGRQPTISVRARAPPSSRASLRRNRRRQRVSRARNAARWLDPRFSRPSRRTLQPASSCWPHVLARPIPPPTCCVAFARCAGWRA